MPLPEIDSIESPPKRRDVLITLLNIISNRLSIFFHSVFILCFLFPFFFLHPLIRETFHPQIKDFLLFSFFFAFFSFSLFNPFWTSNLKLKTSFYFFVVSLFPSFPFLLPKIKDFFLFISLLFPTFFFFLAASNCMGFIFELCIGQFRSVSVHIS